MGHVRFHHTSLGSYLAVEIQEVKGVDAHLDFDLRRVHVLQGGIKTDRDASITLLPLTKKNYANGLGLRANRYIQPWDFVTTSALIPSLVYHER